MKITLENFCIFRKIAECEFLQNKKLDASLFTQHSSVVKFNNFQSIINLS